MCVWGGKNTDLNGKTLALSLLATSDYLGSKKYHKSMDGTLRNITVSHKPVVLLSLSF